MADLAPHAVDQLADTVRRLEAERDAALAAERAARVAIGVAQRRASMLAAASAELASSLDWRQTVDRVARLMVPAMADWCVVDVAEPDEAGGTRLRRMAAAHADPEKERLIGELRGRYETIEATTPHTARRVLGSGRSWLDANVSDERLERESRDGRHYELMRQLGFRTEMAIQLLAGERALGTMTLVGGEGRQFDEADLAFAEERAHRCALGIANAQAFEAAERSRVMAQRAVDRTNRLQEIAGQLGQSLDADLVLAAIARSAADLLNAPVGAVLLLDPANPGADFALAAAHGIEADLAPELRLPRHASLAGRAIDLRRTLVVDDAGATDDTALPRLLTGKATGSEIAAPVMAGEAPLGVVKAFSPLLRSFDAEDAALLTALAAAASAALTNARLYRQAQEAIEARDEFLATAAHDLKNPLTIVKGGAQLLRRELSRGDALDRDRLAVGLASLDAAATRVSRQVDGLLDITRHRSGVPMDLQRRTTDLIALARQVAAEYRQASEAHSVRVETDLETLVGYLDRGRLERLLDNLLSNAVKYSPGGGEVVLSVARELGDAVIAVCDRGIGIPPDELERIFERFGRGSNVPHHIGGSGIGLTSVRQIVEAHGGAICVESRVGAGTTFRVHLPLVPDGR